MHIERCITLTLTLGVNGPLMGLAYKGVVRESQPNRIHHIEQAVFFTLQREAGGVFRLLCERREPDVSGVYSARRGTGVRHQRPDVPQPVRVQLQVSVEFARVREASW